MPEIPPFILLFILIAALYMVNRRYLSYRVNYSVDEVLMIFKTDVVECNFINPGTGEKSRYTLQIDNTISPYGGVRHKKKMYRIFPDTGTRVNGIMSYKWVLGYCDPVDERHPKI
ncbi:unnamed protein product, partial [marine sediment metagenome]